MTSFGVHELVALQRSFLDFIEGLTVSATSMKKLGPLSSLWVQPDGHWRPDGPARVRRTLKTALTKFAEAERRIEDSRAKVEDEARRVAELAGEPVPPRALREPLGWQDMVDVLGAVWGLDRYPIKPSTAVQRQMQKRKDVPTDLFTNIDVGAWGAQVLADARVLPHVAASLPEPPPLAPREQPIPDGARPSWIDVPDSDWPCGAARQVYEKRELLATVRETWRTKAPLWPPLEKNQDVVGALRGAAATRLRAYFDDPAERHARLKIEHAAEAWRLADKSAFSEGHRDRSSHGRLSGSSSRYKEKTSHAAELLFWSIAHGWEGDAILDHAKSRLYDTPMLDAMVAHQRDDPLSDAALAKRFASALPAGAAAGLVIGKAEIAPHLTIRSHESPFGPTEAMELADKVRRASGEIRIELARRYVEQRVAYDRTSPPPNLTLFLADVSVELDLVYSHHNDAVINDLRACKRRALGDDGRGLAYMLFELRNDALFDAQHVDYTVAFTKYLDGIQWLTTRAPAFEGKEYLETLQQYWLALAGLCTKVIESQLRVTAKHRDENVERAVVFAIKAADEAEENLLALDRDHSLQDARHADDHISSTGWRVHTRLTRLRALLAVHTVVESRLAAHSATRGHGPASLAAIADAYQVLLSASELGSGNRSYVLQLAIWFALLNGGTLPNVREIAAEFVRGSDDDPLPVLLTLDPDLVEDLNVTTLDLDVIRASEWIVEQGDFPSTLATVWPHGPVAQVIAERWSGFHDWRERFGPPPAVAKPAKG